MTLPAIFLLYDLIKPFDRDAKKEESSLSVYRFLSRMKEVLKAHWRFYLELFLIALSFTFYKVFIRNPSHQEGFYGGTMASNFLTVLRIWVFYIKLLILPFSLNADRSFPLSKSLFEFMVILSIVVLLALFVLLIKSYKGKSWFPFCGFWFFITLLPVSHIFPHHELLAEHYLYLPSFGFFLAIGLLSAGLLQRERWRPFIHGFLVALFIFYSYQTIHRNFDWKDDLTLWTDCVKKSPNKARPRNNLGIAFSSRGRYQEAIAQFSEALKLNPNFAAAHYNLGKAFSNWGRYQEAIPHFTEALRIKPNYAEAHNNLGTVFISEGKYPEAIDHFTEALRIQPNDAEVHSNLGDAFVRQGEIQEGIDHYVQALQIRPDFSKIHYSLALAYSMIGNRKLAIKEYEILKTRNSDLANILSKEIFK